MDCKCHCHCRVDGVYLTRSDVKELAKEITDKTVERVFSREGRRMFLHGITAEEGHWFMRRHGPAIANSATFLKLLDKRLSADFDRTADMRPDAR